MAGHIPPRQQLGRHRAFDIEYLVHIKAKGEHKGCRWSGRSAMGLPLPEWQRPYEWDLTQQERFIESIYKDLYHGVYVVNSTDYVDSSGCPKKFSSALIDGQQRITTLERYLSGEFKVFGAYWLELSKAEHRRFLTTPFHCIEVDIWDEMELRDLSDRLAFGGTTHKDEYRATKGYNYSEQSQV
ncbi:DUF262 domain-containing protein [Photobacterium kishitanii]|uniref:GmrSD restriction endonucleases N-terminal domain-containing protein n=1 Tax=Photobacterium kishitanii TaxID=318456 RepID=A0A2T3KLI6_9GAMM|nr:DUF262 domain-containing protein [Photobacterium kishitanii]PSV00578.1 hypothetical protein C9J27_05430 [Photobacterium kishitanii]